jgi:hypothetical protein
LFSCAYPPDLLPGVEPGPGLGYLHSDKWAFALTAALMLVQMIAWIAIFQDLGGGYFFSLIVVLPYTVIGAVFSGTVASLLRRRARGNRARVYGPPEHPSNNEHPGLH